MFMLLGLCQCVLCVKGKKIHVGCNTVEIKTNIRNKSTKVWLQKIEHAWQNGKKNDAHKQVR